MKRTILPIGHNFGRWTVLGDVNSVNGVGRTLCRCECGIVRSVETSKLICGESKSCGCLRKQIISNVNIKPIEIGSRFGRLTVVKRSNNHKSSTAYLCKCDCGNEKEIVRTSLVSGITKSCGCLAIESAKKILTKHGLSKNPFYKRHKQQMRRDSDANWTTEMQDCLMQHQRKCIICGSEYKLQIDHVKPFSKGGALRPGNAVVLCKSCNIKKGNKDLHTLPDNMKYKIKRAAISFCCAWNWKASLISHE